MPPPLLSLDVVGLSPWEERGRHQVFGFASNPSSCAMVRMTLPEGEVLDRVDLTDHAPPIGSPCWFPGTLARVLYTGADGRIYRLDFETPRPGVDLADGAGIRPRALNWWPPVPAFGEAALSDLSWPDDPRWGGRLLASVYPRSGASGDFLDRQIWWLELDRDGTSIVAAGPLIQPEAGEGAISRRRPTLVRDSGGTPTLAYLAGHPRRPGYELRAVPVRFDAGSDVPHAREAEARVLASGCSSATPVATRDGRWITVVRPEGRSVRAERVDLGEGARSAAEVAAADLIANRLARGRPEGEGL